MRRIWGLCVVAVTLSGVSYAQVQVEDIWNRAKATVENTSAANLGLTDSKISAGLKEALTVSTGKAVAATGHPDGFFKNQAIKILLPDNLRKIGNGMRMVGMGSQVDALELGMNRAAEQAAPEAKKIFLNAVTNMTFADARNILSGDDTAATEYFRRTSSDQLTEAFTPIVHHAMENVGVIQQYDRVINSASFGPWTAAPKKLDLDAYVVQKTLDGLFYMLGQEEKHIRTNPAAQTTALLKQVFGHASSGSSHNDEGR
ncbi:MAG TPA: DUF4197 domain-containing protein [Terriglobales bacterium]|nr:DUF4197 domain-containing protein [Terriglobales bacterium]